MVVKNMSFIFYKFSQSPSITFLSVFYFVFSLLFWGLNVNAVLSSVLALISFCIIFIPIFAFFYPLLFTMYGIASVFIVPQEAEPQHIILIFVLIITVIRFGFMIIFSIKNPELSKMYDFILRKK